MNQGKPVFSDSYLGLELYQVQSQQAVGPDKHTLKVAFDYGGAGGARGAGGKASLFIDGQKVGEGRIFQMQANTFSFERYGRHRG